MRKATRIELAPETADDFDRVLNHLLVHEVGEAATRVQEILAAIDVLATNPLIGRPVEGDLKELVIGKGARGYVALYRYTALLDIVFILAIRGQREAGYGRGVI